LQADRTALGDVSETQIVAKPFLDDELISKVRATLRHSTSRKVVPLRR
jgi:hypothetical protein